MKQAIRDNRRHYKYEKMLRRVRLHIFEYEYAGKLEKAERIIAKCKAICGPRWEKRARQLEEEQTLHPSLAIRRKHACLRNRTIRDPHEQVSCRG